MKKLMISFIPLHSYFNARLLFRSAEILFRLKKLNVLEVSCTLLRIP